MAAAARIEAAGGRVIHMEVGQPAAPAPSTAIAAARKALSGRIAYTEALGIPSLRARIARHYGETHGIEVDPAAWSSPPGRRRASFWPFSPCSSPATGWRSRAPAIRPTATS